MIEDKYASFSELAKIERYGKDFQVRLMERRGTMAVIAPHGGGIEPGTSEVAEAVAGDDFSFYAFEGIKATGNRGLHITSTRFDEPRGVNLVRAAPCAISIHGEDDKDQIVFLGGRDEVTLSHLRKSLSASGFSCQTPESALEGRNLKNICNRTANGAGVQLELSEGLRHSFFESLYTRSGRSRKTVRFRQFVAAVREAIGE